MDQVGVEDAQAIAKVELRHKAIHEKRKHERDHSQQFITTVLVTIRIPAIRHLTRPTQRTPRPAVIPPPQIKGIYTDKNHA